MSQGFVGVLCVDSVTLGAGPVAEFYISEFGKETVTFLKRSDTIRIETLGLYFVAQGGQRDSGITVPRGLIDYRGTVYSNLYRIGDKVFRDVHVKFLGRILVSAGVIKNEFVQLGSLGQEVTITFTGNSITPKDTRVRVFEEAI